jgi:ribosomal protein L7/L12
MPHDKKLDPRQSEGFKELSIIELSDFVALFEETFDITAAAVRTAEPPAADVTARPLGRAERTRENLLKTMHGKLILAAINMERSVEALGPALAQVEVETSPQLARSMQATENAWRKMEAEFGLLTSLEISKAVGSKSPNRSYASDQRAAGKLLAVKRPGGFKYPGFQLDRHEHTVRPVIQDLIKLAADAGRSEAGLALWIVSPTGYLDGSRPVDLLDEPETVVEAARQSFNVQW